MQASWESSAGEAYWLPLFSCESGMLAYGINMSITLRTSEPIIAKAMLMEKESFDLVIPEIPGLVGAYPAKLHAEFHATRQEYRIIFPEFAAGST